MPRHKQLNDRVSGLPFIVVVVRKTNVDPYFSWKPYLSGQNSLPAVETASSA